MITRLNIVIIDDDKEILDLFSLMLEAQAQVDSVSSFDSIDSAISRLTEPETNIAILDLNLVDTQGIGTLIKFRSIFPEMPVVVVTGQDQSGLSYDCFAAGASEYLVKPNIGSTLIYKACLYAVEKHATRKEAQQDLIVSERRYRRLFEGAQDGILILDFNTGLILEANKFLVDLLGYTHEEFLEKHLWEVSPFKDIGLNKETFLKLQSEGYVRYEDLPMETGAGVSIDVEFISNVYKVNGQTCIQCNIRDISERKLSEKLFHIRLNLLEYSAINSLGNLIQTALDEVVGLTSSSIGFYHFINEDEKTITLQQWSTRTLNEFCNAEGTARHYPIDQGGVWVDAVRERHPVIHNDYATLPHRKGMPEGHATLIRELVVPILRADKVVAILGIGNKPIDYTDKDVEVVSYLADVVWEIVERKRVEEALKESELKFREVVENANTVILGLDTEGNLTYINEFGLQFYGYREDEILNKSVVGTIVPERESTGRDLRKMLGDICAQPEKFDKNINENICSDGRVVWTEWTNKARYSPEGEIIGVFCIGADITDRKKAQEALLESETRYKSLYTQVRNGVVVFSPVNGGEDFLILDLNRAAECIEGIRREDVLGRPVIEVFPGIKEFGLFEVLQRVCRSGNSEHLPTALYVDPRMTGWRENFVYRLPSHEVVAVYTDETDRKRSEEALHQINRDLEKAKTQWEMMFNAAPDLIMLLDLDHRILRVNTATITALGRKEEEIIGLKCYELFHGTDEPPDWCPTRLLEWCPEAGKPEGTCSHTVSASLENLDKDFMISIHPLKVDDTLQGFVHIARDISEIRQVEQQLRDKQFELWEVEMAKSEDLVEQARALNAGIAHELRTPLQALTNIMEFIRESVNSLCGRESDFVEAASEEEVEELLGDAQDKLKYSLRVLESLSLYARAGTSKSMDLINVVLEMRTVIKTLRFTDKFKGLLDEQIVVEGVEGPCIVKMNSSDFSQLFINLCKNAREAIVHDHPQIKIVIEKALGLVDIHVIDNGGGVPRHAADEIFKPYYSTKEPDSGHNQGLGLSIVKAIVLSYQGQISYESVPGHTDFCVTLPCAEQTSNV
jgi:PAS domain S-box-containing protein